MTAVERAIMPYSHNQEFAVGCTSCGRQFGAKVWFIIDPKERPDVARSVLAGQLNVFSCPNCRQLATPREPVLLYQPAELPAVVIALAEGAGPEDSSDQCENLLALLYAQMPTDERARIFANKDVFFPDPILIPRGDLRSFLDASGNRPKSASLRAIMLSLQDIPPQAFPKDIVSLAQRALELLDRKSDPQRWAWVKGLIASHTDDCELAITHLRDSLTVFTRETSPVNWARGKRDLGLLFVKRTNGIRAENIETAISNFRSALDILTPASYPEPSGMLNNDLSVTYTLRVLGERAENQELSLHHAKVSLQAFDKSSFPENWAQSQIRVGAAYRDRILGESAKNLSSCIDHYGQALEFYTSQRNRRDWAGVRSLLGQVHLDRAKATKSQDDVEKAMGHIEATLEVITRMDEPDAWAGNVSNLAGAYALRQSGDRTANIEKAIHYFEQTELIATRELFPDQWADCQANLANMRMLLAGMNVNRKENLTKAVKRFQRALSVYNIEYHPKKFLDTQKRLGEIYFAARDWAAGHEALGAAMNAFSRLYASAFTDAGRRVELATISGISSRDAYALVNLGRPAEGLVRLEQGRALLLQEALQLETTDFSELDEEQRLSLKTARQSIDRLEGEMRQPAIGPRHDRRLAEELRIARIAFQTLAAKVQDSSKPAKSRCADLDDILSVVPRGGASIAFINSGDRGPTAFVIPHGRQTISRDDVIELNFPATQPKVSEEIRQAVEASCQLLSEMLRPVFERLAALDLPKGAPINIMNGSIARLPIHAAYLESAAGRRHVLDDYTFRYFPNSRLLKVCESRANARSPLDSSMLAVVNPTGDLRFCRYEADALQSIFEHARLVRLEEKQASMDAVIRAAKGRSYLHFACHAYFSPDEAMRSGLRLADDNLTASDVIAKLDLSKVRLVTLSACETGMTDFTNLPEESVGLPSAFLQAGAPAVISTSWPVNDLSTMLLMHRFYKLHLEDRLEASVALRDAQRWLRDATQADLAGFESRPRRSRLSRGILRKQPRDEAIRASILLGCIYIHRFLNHPEFLVLGTVFQGFWYTLQMVFDGARRDAHTHLSGLALNRGPGSRWLRHVNPGHIC
jgi:CHAT domain-containing protein/tetratricopeptide (TPR) repeat protein